MKIHWRRVSAPPKPEPFRLRARDVVLESGAERTIVRLMVQTVTIGLIGVTALLIVVGGLKVFAYARESAASAEGVGQTVTITISKHDGEPEVAHKLRAAGVIHSELYFKTVLKLKGGLLVPGSYNLPKGLSVSEVITLITR